MKKYRYRKAFQRALSAFLCLSMVLSLFVGTGLTGLYSVTKSANAEDSSTGTATEDEYKYETLEYMWSKKGNDDPDEDFLNASRPNYACRTGNFGGVEYRTIFHVFAFEGDTICIGSSVADSQIDENFTISSTKVNDKGSVDVVMTDLNGVTHAIDIRNSYDDGVLNQTGYIGDWQTEWAAIKCLHKENGKFFGTYNYMDQTTGETTAYTYTPYTYTVTETGVYTFEFHSYNNNVGAIDNPHKRSDNFAYTGKTLTNGLIAALNLTVFDESGVEQHGRTYADFLSLEMDPAGATGIKDSYYILTTDSYIYKMTFNNAAPYTYNFFANNKGLYDPATGEIIYTSVKDVTNANTFARMGAAYKYPGTKDTDMLKSYYIFLEYPDDQLEGEMYEKPVAPDPATNLRFVSQIIDNYGHKVTGAYAGEGGYFAFDVEEATTATLRLEFKAKDEHGEKIYAPVEISGAVTPHTTNYFYWNGKDGNGKIIPPDKYDIEDLAFTVTTKAGEIHFPIIDMEFAKGGITFERMSHIYNKNGEQLDKDDNIYGKTKNVIYYDETAIYYGENAASTGFSEADVTGKNDGDNNLLDYVINKFFKYYKGEDRYWPYINVGNSSGGEYQARQTNYINKNPNVRVGDHSHTTNVINYFDERGNPIKDNSQDAMIEYLDSLKHPVAMSPNNTNEDSKYNNVDYWTNAENDPAKGVKPASGNCSTTDHAIANFWTFIPAQPASASTDLTGITIEERPENSFSLTGRVFFDADGKGTFDDMSENGDYGLSGVTLNLYKKTSDTSFIAGKTYVSYDASSNTVEILDSSKFLSATNRYELVDSQQTTGDGMYKFTGLEYDPDNGTEYLYQVVKPLDNYTLTTGGKNAAAIQSGSTGVYYGYYADKSYNNSYKGTEVQRIIVGGTGVNPKEITCNKDENESRTVCAVDVGYNYAVMKQSLELKKSWDTGTENHPTAVAYEIKYHLQNSSEDKLYKYRVISAIDAWRYEDEYLPQQLNGGTVDNYYVSAEYYLKDSYIYKHEFDYNSDAGKYESFVGEVYSAPLTELSKLTGTEVKNFSNIPDLSVLKSLTWEEVTENEPYRAVLDRNVGSDKSTITITNADDPGTIEIFKYSGENKEENALQGATFRIYKLEEGKVTLDDIKRLASSNDPADIAELITYQVGSGTTRANGRIAFPGLDPNGTYVIREVTPPAGYRILNEFYEVKPYVSGMSPDDLEKDKANGIYYFNSENYIQVDVGNAPADSNFYILKRIEGRAWQSNDEFSFSITNAFDKDEANDNITAADGITIDLEEYSKIYESNSTTVLDEAGKFAKHFHKDATTTGDKVTVTVDNAKPFYSYEAKDQNVENKTNTYTYPDRKMSEALLKDGKKTTTNPTEGYPTFRDVEFPFAGTYTFTITEDDFAAGTEETLTKSDREYTVTITVKRVRNSTTDAAAELTKDNSHLEAEVSSITYKDDKDGVSQIFAGSSPLFTNVYAPAPAKQDTSYNIVKEFTGRPGGEWLENDEFTIRVSGVDTETQSAIKNENLVIDGFNTALVDNGTTKEWVHTFTKDAHDEWDFKSFTFNDIMFPVQYVNDKGEVWTPPAGSEQTVPTQDEINAGLTPQTVPVTYWLKIEEVLPADMTDNTKDGIKYDSNVYYLKIVLRNAEAKVSAGTTAGKEEEDGIIDKIDMNLYHVDKTMTDVAEIEKQSTVATCHTEAVVLDDADWFAPAPTPDTDDESYKWFYVGNDGKLYSDSAHSVRPANAKILVRRHETHTGKHTMTITNTYSTSCSWAPQVKKVLEGRDWLEDEEFTFTITPVGDSGGCDLAADGKSITITKADAASPQAFGAITFTKPGDYTFTITEKNKSGDVLCSYTFTVTLTDDALGHLELSYKEPASAVVSGDVFTFTNTYTGVDFDLNITKQLIGREWGSDETFTFKITPDTDDTDTKTAIEKGIIVMPSALGSSDPSDGSYTVTVGNDAHTKELGNIQIINTGDITTETEYKFTISEVTDSFTDMYCRDSEAVLVIKLTSTDAAPGVNKLSYTNTLKATYTLGDGTPVALPTDPIVVPFVNVATGTLTVGKKVVSSTSADETEFEFKVEFTYDETSTTDVDHVINAYKNTTKITPDSGSDNVFTFKLKDGEEVVFSSIPPNTEYKITETIPSTQAENYMLLRVCNGKTDNGTDIRTDPKGNSVSGTINPKSDGDDNEQYRLFVNGLIKRLPSAGGAGIGGYIFFGAALTIGGLLILAVLYSKCKKRREISE